MGAGESLKGRFRGTKCEFKIKGGTPILYGHALKWEREEAGELEKCHA